MATSPPPARWLLYVSHARWLKFHHPPNWSIEEQDGVVELQAPDNAARMALQCMKVTPKPGVKVEPMDIASITPHGEGAYKLNDLDLPYETMGVGGDVGFWQGRPEWQSIAEGGDWKRWQVWAIRHETMMVMAFYVQAGPHDPEGETLARAVLNTIQLADEPTLSANEFVRQFFARAKKLAPQSNVEQLEEMSIVIGDAIVNLENAYRQYVTQPDEFEAIVRRGVEMAINAQQSGVDFGPPWKDVQRRLMPMLFPEDQWKSGLSHLAGESWVAGLAILYVVDEENAFWYVRSDLLDGWGVTQQKLHQTAMKNLDEYFQKNPVNGFLAGGSGQGMMMPERRDSYNASRILSPDFQSTIRRALGREFVVGLPQRDFYIAMSLGDRDVMELVRKQVAADFRKQDHPLTDRLLLVSPDGVSEHCK